MASRDPQRSRCYRFEQFYLKPKGAWMDEEGMNLLSEQVYADLDFASPPEVRYSTRVRGGVYYGGHDNRIVINWTQKQIVLHELAHSLAEVYFGSSVEAHGPEFVTINIELALAYLWEAPKKTFVQLVRLACDVNGLRVYDEPILRPRFEKHAWATDPSGP